MKLCRFLADGKEARLGVVENDVVIDLSTLGLTRLIQIYEGIPAQKALHPERLKDARHLALSETRLLAPVDEQEVWAAGVTYERSKKARMEESDFSATAYDRVYDSERPELFFKSVPEKVVSPAGFVGIRSDSKWNVPEPELALVIDSQGRIVGCTIGNDMSSRDIEGENLLYLPQAKIYEGSCALGPFVLLCAEEELIRKWEITISIERNGAVVFEGSTSIGRIRRRLDDLVQFLFRSQRFPSGVVLLTGTGIVPADDFSIEAGDKVAITIPAIGTLENIVAVS
jgi:2-dehydro-3-deoxy-D-arabinonate dehydratase